MRVRKFISIIVGLMAVLVFYRSASAAYLVLTRIGNLSTSGVLYSTWTYSGPVPDMAGTATPGAVVAVTVNAVTATVSAGVDGVWVVNPVNIIAGSNSVSVASGNEVLSFLLSYTPPASPTATVTQAATPSGALPAAGVLVWPLGLVAAGLIIFFAGKKTREAFDDKYFDQ